MKETNCMHVYCRVRPLAKPNIVQWLQVKPPATVAVTPPTDLQHYKNTGLRETRYTFQKVFDEKASQQDICREVGQPLVEFLLCGRDSLLFTYGITGSGKTYTLTGDAENRGLMWRCLDLLFTEIADIQTPKGVFKPDGLNGFDFNPLRPQNASTPKHSKLIGRMVAIFVTYVEFYNNSVYDLLEAGSFQKSLQSRIIREDIQHSQMYVHGVTEVEVKSFEEALLVFQMGQKRKRMSHTLLNAESSRSHSAFNVRLVQATMDDAESIAVTQLTLVDLAGSERTTRTKSSGLRLREASSINNSLLTLRTCLEYLRENQNAPAGTPLKKIPYRDSKITHMFKNYFEGEGHISMIVCINQRVTDYGETLHVLKFAEITQELQVTRSAGLNKRQAVPAARSLKLSACNNGPDAIENVIYELSSHFPLYEENFENDFMLKELQSFLIKRIKKREILNIHLESKCSHLQIQVKSLKSENLEMRATVDTLQAAFDQERERNHVLTQKLHSQTASIDDINERFAKCKNEMSYLQKKLSMRDADLKQKSQEEADAKHKYRNKLAVVKDRKDREFELRLSQQTAVLEEEIRKKDEKLRLVSNILQAEDMSSLRRSISFDNSLHEMAETSKRPSSTGSYSFRRSQSLDCKTRNSNKVKPQKNVNELTSISNSDISSDSHLTTIVETQELHSPKRLSALMDKVGKNIVNRINLSFRHKLTRSP